ncbi:MAG TPA: D-erythronate dehydrogenase [Chthoniobacterales bacterium]
MKVLVTGAAGMLGRKFCQELATVGVIAGQKVESLTMVDIVESPPIPGSPFTTRAIACDLGSPGVAERVVAERPDIVLHTAAIVSGEAEADFDKGYRINVDGTRYLFEALRKAGNRPRVVFTSSIAVFGAPFPDVIGEEFFLTPLTSYGTQKAIGELLLADYTRKGFFDGIGIRLPTICVRPGKPNRAASSFFSGIIREPLSGQEAILPVPDTVRHWFASPRSAVQFFFRAAEIDGASVGDRRNLSMPGLSATVGEMIESLERCAGADRVNLIRREPDSTIMRIVEGWARNLDASRARSLGFQAETNFDEIIRAHIEDQGIKL